MGPSDWEDHSLGKEGAERYRVHNLPNCSSCSGLYELGIAVPHSSSSRETSKLDPDCIIPVYLGQAENVRTRLQRYGREGAHLENGKPTSELNYSTQQGLGLFTDIFARCYSVVYRWAPVSTFSFWSFELLDLPWLIRLIALIRRCIWHRRIGFGTT